MRSVFGGGTPLACASRVLLRRCAWHRRHYGYSAFLGVASWHGRSIQYTDGICRRCAALEKIRLGARSAQGRPATPGRWVAPSIVFAGAAAVVGGLLASVTVFDRSPAPRTALDAPVPNTSDDVRFRHIPETPSPVVTGPPRPAGDTPRRTVARARRESTGGAADGQPHLASLADRRSAGGRRADDLQSLYRLTASELRVAVTPEPAAPAVPEPAPIRNDWQIAGLAESFRTPPAPPVAVVVRRDEPRSEAP
jgi:hypothetical protein